MPIVRLQNRRDTAANWTTNNPVLSSGEIGFEINTGRAKFGNGSSAWTDLPYFSLGWIDFAANWDTPPTTVSAGVLSYTWLGVTRYRTVPNPYLASGDAFYSDAGLTNLIVARGQ